MGTARSQKRSKPQYSKRDFKIDAHAGYVECVHCGFFRFFRATTEDPCEYAVKHMLHATDCKLLKAVEDAGK